MSFTDCNFPIIDMRNTPKEDYGLGHGEEYAKQIAELSSIRRELMLKKNPALKDQISKLALEQLKTSEKYNQALFKELSNISKSSNVSLEDLIILNNYTDFRDIQLPDEGCTTISIKKDINEVGQTWDMHGSAANYLCMLLYPEKIVFSLVGCLGMMGVNKSELFIGVNNINTLNARAALIWPMLVSHILDQGSLETMRDELKGAPVTSGHNYLLSSKKRSEHWEISPTMQKMPLYNEIDDNKNLVFHTNHCLDESLKLEEDNISTNSTTFDRYRIMEEFNNQTHQDLYSILTSHEGYPKSICSHSMSTDTDPSMTCGGGVFNHETSEFKVWRGCKKNNNYLEHSFNVKEILS